MLRYIARRLIILIPELLIISLLVFLIMQAAPGDFLDQYRIDPTVSKEFIQALEKQYGLDKPVMTQYFLWLKGIFKGDFGYSFYYRRPVMDLIGERVLATLILSLYSFVISWIVGIVLGIVSALKKYSFWDKFLTVIAFTGIAIPGFFLALLLLYMAAKTGWLPVAGMYDVNHKSMTVWQGFKDIFWHMQLPAFTLTFGGFAGLMRYMRGSLLDVLNEDYVEFARAKGMPERVVIFKHAVRNAINPLITMFGFSLSSLLGGAVITETIFSWPGLGRLVYQALQQQDMYVVMASTVISVIMLVVGNLIGDILLAAVDPRIRLE
ncbi:ABC transporter substrate-binding protein [Thermosipho melanesiensis]|uniref:Binding-protein-dependent transport systems inner membrane component n=2 Tax=Thermosipho melanesiensis TaxID=46541 RepID=A6LMT3_THEM4|nr:ABC transporter permease [Thermosipho melanesiensis]ABR31234.1 binding-protein-dependent transport systems inner membrane component [Thermosipho melanesiensis BI429]APT74318.1 ABC transporter substrate-binding protein [Thermosipho melanesiensis]OOC36259.1 ABC transporter substrate-binding protein [Thermosipho melanesiensis]OOC37077.1 ABC transporter substrate-binding protein [Thermosipho melanesiensis]OOC37829.1 ABC transporter substrate-binding protein [Thermosipho melanesiensis]